jgi:hypothetical protein
MKNILYLLFAVATLFYSFTTFQSTDAADKKALSANCKKKLDTYKYDSQKFTKINFTNKTQLLEIEIPVFIGEKYRIIFNTNGLPKPIKIYVYKKDKNSNKREPIYTSPANYETNELVFDAPRVGKLFVDYEVPANEANSTITSGFALFMVGYK